MLGLKSLDNLRICEVGVGYGGQSRVINAIFTPKSYDFVDLSPVLKLTKKYLSYYKLECELNFIDIEHLEHKEYDLFISNYAFSELNRKIQEIYTNVLIKHSKYGYITYNDISPDSLKSYKVQEYATLFDKEIKVYEEIPNTHFRNKIILW